VFGLGGDLLAVDEHLNALLDRYGLESSGAVLIRPDGFVGFRSATRAGDEHGALESALHQILHLTDPVPRSAHSTKGGAGL
jgi:hypothetical protein